MKLGPAVLVVAAALAAGPAASAMTVPGPSSGRPAPRCQAGRLYRVGTPTVAFAALMKRERTPVVRRPRKARIARFPKLNQNGYPTTFAIVGAILNGSCRPSWYRVKLPIRPNGAVGYVRPADVLVERVTTRIEVDLSERRLYFYRGRKLVLTTPVAVGSPATPTPLGRYYVNQRIVTTNPGGAFGPAALGVSAFSDVLTGWTQGGPIGIHGTNQPWSIGRAVSNGCIRVPNDVLERIFDASRGGTPVVFRA